MIPVVLDPHRLEIDGRHLTEHPRPEEQDKRAHLLDRAQDILFRQCAEERFEILWRDPLARRTADRLKEVLAEDSAFSSS